MTVRKRCRPAHGHAWLRVIVLWACATCVLAEDSGESVARGTAEVRQHVAEALLLIGREDSFSAIEYIGSTGDPLFMLEVYRGVTDNLVSDRHMLTAALVIGRAGIQDMLRAARAARGDDVRRLLDGARSLAFQLSSYTWPGWGADAVVVSQTDLLLGQDLAQANLRLAREVESGDAELAQAYWLLGAHYLAADKTEGARRAFIEATKHAIASGDRTRELLLRGYIYLADVLLEPANQALAGEFDRVGDELDTLPEGAPLAAQLRTARATFAAAGE